MSVLWMDGFDKYGSTSDLALRYSNAGGVNSFQATGGRDGGGAMRIEEASFGSSFTATLGADVAAGEIHHVVFWVNFDGSAPSDNSASAFVTFNDASTSVRGSISLGENGNGEIQAKKWDDFFTTLATSASHVFSLSTWHHVEVAVKFANSGGFWKVWVDGVLVINFSGDNNADVSDPTVRECRIRYFGSGGSSVSFMTVDDFVWWTESGGGLTTTQLGAHRIETLTPDANGAGNAWTASAGSNYQCVDDAGFHNGDTDYVETVTASNVDLYTLGNLSFSPATIFGVQVVARAKYTDSTSLLDAVAYSAGSSAYGTGVALTSSYKQSSAFFEVDPSTSSDWDVSGVNAMQAGVKKET